tara:strand:- start:31443 stop:32069 length:627 start_codon:yes stop_codon:yes gene_type:complete
LKEKIKQKAISLFNAHGMSNVSMKQIADALGISAGNLQYHFKDKEALVTAVYDDMYSESVNFILPKNTYITLFHFEAMMVGFDGIQNRFSFFYNDLVHIVKTYPNIADRQEQYNLVRLTDARKLMDYYVETGRLIPESATVDYDKIIHVIWMTSMFWQSQKRVMRHAEYKGNKCPVMDMNWSFVLPFLTKKGLEEYEQIKKFVKHPNH